MSMAMAERKNIEFGVEGGVTLRGWLFVPGAKGPAPAITMAHSYAGGHAIVLGATDRRLKAVVAQVPTISGFEQGLRRVSPDGIAALERAFAEDDCGQLRGEPLRRQLIVSDDLAIPASYRSKDAIDFYLQPTPPDIWENSVTIRSTRAARMYEPGIWVPRVSPTPLLMVVALSDTITVIDLALAAYERALEPKRLHLISGGHFAPYLDQFPLAVAAATEWFSEHLLNPDARGVTQVAIHSAYAQANSDMANVWTSRKEPDNERNRHY
jgi:uncharacterized protein